jgi:hypothetical protein
MTILEALCIVNIGVGNEEEREVYKKASKLLWIEGSRIMLRERMLNLQKKLDGIDK